MAFQRLRMKQTVEKDRSPPDSDFRSLFTSEPSVGATFVHKQRERGVKGQDRGQKVKVPWFIGGGERGKGQGRGHIKTPLFISRRGQRSRQFKKKKKKVKIP